MSKEPIWKPDNKGEYHLGDLMYNLEEAKQKRKERSDVNNRQEVHGSDNKGKRNGSE